MNLALRKELRPLFFPWLISAIGGLLPPDDGVTSVFGTLLNFGSFAVLAALVFAIEFQERTLPLLLSQPVARRRLWNDKFSAIGVAAASLILLNWRVHVCLGVIRMDLGPLFGELLLLAVICSAGFWIQTTRSLLGGLALNFVIQMLVFFSFGILTARWLGPRLPGQGQEILQTLTAAGLFYCGSFLWLSRTYWKERFVEKLTLALVFIVLFGAGELLSDQGNNVRSGAMELCLMGLFILATFCSAPWWTMVARTTIGGAVLTVACELLVLLAAKVVFSQLSGTDVWFENGSFLGLVVVGTPLYSLLFLRGAWRRFSRLEVKEAAYSEIPTDGRLIKFSAPWGAWLRCRPQEGMLNLIRKELQLQKPLFLLAAVFCICWFSIFSLHWLQPHHGYATLGDILICVYAPLSLALAGCISLGEEKNLGLMGWNLSLPVSPIRQWLLKLLVAGVIGCVVGMLLPFGLACLSARVLDSSLLMKESENAWIALAGISGALFILSFWSATLVNNTLRAALIAVFALLPLFLCGMLGSWCAQQCSGLPQMIWWAMGADGRPEVPGILGVLGCVGLIASIALVQSLLHFRRVRLRGATILIHTLVLGLGVVAGSFWWTAVLLSRGG